MDIFLIIGFVGMALILLAFFMNQVKRWNQDDLVYDLVNFIGSALLVVSAVPARSWPFVILNTVWALVSFKDVITDIQRDMKKKALAK
jgi:hypothetical protein